MAELALEILNVRCGYRAAPVLHGVTFVVGAGQFLGVVGPNGSGKTTLLRAISRALAPLGGRVLLSGRDVLGLAPRAVAREVAVVSQDPPADMGFTVEQFVLLGRLPHLGRLEPEGPRDWEAARSAMVRVGVERLAGRRLGELSGGERQKVALARAFCQAPRVLLLDEPTAHLDINHQVEVMDTLDTLRREDDLTVLAVLHDLNLAALYCDRLLLLAGGRIDAAGPPEAVLTEERLRRVYGCPVRVGRHPVTGTPLVLPVPHATGRAAGIAGVAGGTGLLR